VGRAFGRFRDRFRGSSDDRDDVVDEGVGGVGVGDDAAGGDMSVGSHNDDNMELRDIQRDSNKPKGTRYVSHVERARGVGSESSNSNDDFEIFSGINPSDSENPHSPDFPGVPDFENMVRRSHRSSTLFSPSLLSSAPASAVSASALPLSAQGMADSAIIAIQEAVNEAAEALTRHNALDDSAFAIDAHADDDIADTTDSITSSAADRRSDTLQSMRVGALAAVSAAGLDAVEKVLSLAKEADNKGCTGACAREVNRVMEDAVGRIHALVEGVEETVKAVQGDSCDYQGINGDCDGQGTGTEDDVVHLDIDFSDTYVATNVNANTSPTSSDGTTGSATADTLTLRIHVRALEHVGEEMARTVENAAEDVRRAVAEGARGCNDCDDEDEGGRRCVCGLKEGSDGTGDDDDLKVDENSNDVDSDNNKPSSSRTHASRGRQSLFRRLAAAHRASTNAVTSTSTSASAGADVNSANSHGPRSAAPGQGVGLSLHELRSRVREVCGHGDAVDDPNCYINVHMREDGGSVDGRGGQADQDGDIGGFTALGGVSHMSTMSSDSVGHSSDSASADVDAGSVSDAVRLLRTSHAVRTMQQNRDRLFVCYQPSG
jgi:hypothetical protein